MTVLSHIVQQCYDIINDKTDTRTSNTLNVQLSPIQDYLNQYSKKPVIYIAGAYKSDRGEFYVRANIREAENCALEVWRAGGIALCPHKNTAGFGGAFGLSESTWLDGDLELLRRCDAIYMVPNWVASPGAQNEKQHAEKWNMPILLNFGELLEFILRWREEHEDTCTS